MSSVLSTVHRERRPDVVRVAHESRRMPRPNRAHELAAVPGRRGHVSCAALRSRQRFGREALASGVARRASGRCASWLCVAHAARANEFSTRVGATQSMRLARQRDGGKRSRRALACTNSPTNVPAQITVIVRKSFTRQAPPMDACFANGSGYAGTNARDGVRCASRERAAHRRLVRVSSQRTACRWFWRRCADRASRGERVLRVLDAMPRVADRRRLVARPQRSGRRHRELPRAPRQAHGPEHSRLPLPATAGRSGRDGRQATRSTRSTNRRARSSSSMALGFTARTPRR